MGTRTVDPDALEAKVKDLYRRVADAPDGDYEFELGRGLAERLGYPDSLLERVPRRASGSFAGVGYFLDLAALARGERVIDLGSGAGMDLFCAAIEVGHGGAAVGIDFTRAQLAKARELAAEYGFDQVELREGRVESLPVEDAGFDCVISNGVINLSPDKEAVFREAARVLRPNGRLALADIVSEQQLEESIVCDTDLWTAHIGGAAQVDTYRLAIETAGLEIELVRDNDYRFISELAANASARYGIRSVSVLARRVR